MPQVDEEPVKEWYSDRANRIVVVGVPWIIAGCCMLGIGGPAALAWFLYFPLGITEHLDRAALGSMKAAIELMVGWIVYLCVTVAVVVVRRRRSSLILYIFLCLLLASNVRGCHSIIVDVETHF